MGIARLLLVGLAILVVVALIVVGALSLIGSLKSDGAAQESPGGTVQGPPTDRSLSSGGTPPVEQTSAGGEVPTLFVECRADRCPIFVRVTGGDVIEDRDLSRGQQAVYTQLNLDVVLADASTVYVEVNGEARPPGKPGERQSLTVKR
ncbi:hypothetical protein GCM10022226_07690 [Sphaerisporangium flaviroseum]|uniref:DUF4115 domain-containing protein n=1 Tax=Sphaerisporangium flaviroseum TaxID=509199 RepID=A0ABP7HGE5_9ACTN